VINNKLKFEFIIKMNNFHIYEEVGRGKYSVVYKVNYSSYLHQLVLLLFKPHIYLFIIGSQEEDYRICCSQISRKKSSKEGPK
jgi:hypothetical protein